MENKKTFDPVKAEAAQRSYCDAKNLPLFIPHGGRCYCWQNIFEKGGYSTEEAGRMLITSCPFCRRSFLD